MSCIELAYYQEGNCIDTHANAGCFSNFTNHNQHFTCSATSTKHKFTFKNRRVIDLNYLIVTGAQYLINNGLINIAVETGATKANLALNSNYNLSLNEYRGTNNNLLLIDLLGIDAANTKFVSIEFEFTAATKPVIPAFAYGQWIKAPCIPEKLDYVKRDSRNSDFETESGIKFTQQSKDPEREIDLNLIYVPDSLLSTIQNQISLNGLNVFLKANSQFFTQLPSDLLPVSITKLSVKKEAVDNNSINMTCKHE